MNLTIKVLIFIPTLFPSIYSLQTSKQKIPLQNVYCIKNTPFTFPVSNGNKYFTQNKLSPANQYFFWNWYKRKRNKNIAHGNLEKTFFPKFSKTSKYTVSLTGNNNSHDKFALTINKCDYKDADEYSLRVQNQAPEEILARYKLSVVRKPDIPRVLETYSLPLREVENAATVRNELVLATCETVSSPKAKIEWYLESDPNYPIESYKTDYKVRGFSKNEWVTTGFLMRDVNRNISENR